MAEPVTVVHRRLCLVVLVLLASYAGLATVVLRIAFGLIGRGLDSTPMQVTEIYWAMWFHGVTACLSGAAALVVRRRAACGPYAPRLILVGGVILLFASVDRLLGVWFPPPASIDSIFAPHPSRGWAHRRHTLGSAGGRTVSINAFGLRGPELPRSKRAGEFRILFIGDSVTFGCRLPYEDIFVTQTEQFLRQRRPKSRIRCVNAGVIGYSTWQEADYLRSEGLAVRPDLIVLCFCFNDVSDLVYLNPGKISDRPMRFSFSNSTHWSGIVRAAQNIQGKRRWQRTLESLRWDDQYLSTVQPRMIKDILREAPRPALARAWQRALGDLERVDAVCRAKGLPWLLVALPLRSHPLPGAPAILPQAKLRRWADRRQVHYLDLLPAFRRPAEKTGHMPEDLFIDEVHLTPDGNRLVASALVRFLIQNQLVP